MQSVLQAVCRRVLEGLAVPSQQTESQTQQDSGGPGNVNSCSFWCRDLWAGSSAMAQTMLYIFWLGHYITSKSLEVGNWSKWTRFGWAGTACKYQKLRGAGRRIRSSQSSSVNSHQRGPHETLSKYIYSSKCTYLLYCNRSINGDCEPDFYKCQQECPRGVPI